MYQSTHPDVVIMLAKQHHEALRRAAGEARVRRSVPPPRIQQRHRWRRK
ncbi:hypothetical protein [Desertimonas flava]|jgi:hypothetical protein|nr:hypothetical protein [Desertimonas flava]